MTKKDDRLKINLRPFLAIIVLLVLVIVGGFAFDKIRTKKHLERLKAHSQVIYQSHQQEITPLLAVNPEDPYKINNLIYNLNLPEKYLRRIYLLRWDATSNQWMIYSDGKTYLPGCGNSVSCPKTAISSASNEMIGALVNPDETIASESEVFDNLLNYYSQGKTLVAAVPIKLEGKDQVTDFLLVLADKKRDF